MDEASKNGVAQEVYRREIVRIIEQSEDMEYLIAVYSFAKAYGRGDIVA